MEANSDDIDNKNLVGKVRDGSEDAFKKLFLKYYNSLVNFAYSYVNRKHVAEEVVQEVLANIWENREMLNPSKNIRSYLFQSVKNRALDYLKKIKTEDKHIGEFKYGFEESVHQEEVKIRELGFKERVQQMINNLPDGARKVYRLSRKDGLTYKEIAEVLDISVKTVESQISRALRILRRKLS